MKHTDRQDSYSILLVDDEPHVVDSLAETIDWRSLRIGHVHRANSAACAMDVLAAQPVDLVMTDLRMPGVDGITLLRRIREKGYRVRCIVLTGHADFEYAQKAIDCRVDKYLLKPIRDEVLAGAVESTIAELEQVSKAEQASNSVRKVFEKHLPRLRSSLLLQLLAGADRFSELKGHELRNLGVSISAGDSIVLLLASFSEPRDNPNARDVEQLRATLREVCDDKYQGLRCEDQYGNLVMLVGAQNKSELSRDLEALIETSHEWDSARFRYILSGPSSFPVDISSAYRAACFEMRGSLGVYAPERDEVATLSTPLNPANADIEYFLNSHQWDEVRSRTEALFEHLSECRPLLREYVVEILYPIVSGFLRAAHSSGASVAQACESEFYELMDSISTASIDTIRNSFFRVFDAIQNLSTPSEVENASSTIDRCREFIHCNLGRAISVQSVADYLSLHPGYLSELYKSETGENLSNYMFRQRMEAAAHMLSATNESVKAIGQKVGYVNAAYFSAAFKKHFGVQPRAYRSGSGSNLSSEV